MVSKSTKNLVTVCGHNPTMLYHMLNHYIDLVDNIYVIVYKNNNNPRLVEQVQEVLDNYKLKIHKVSEHPPYDWNHVTELYNETKMLKPNDWWIVADDDELQFYPKPIDDIIQECEIKNYDFVTGGFLDRLGSGGTFPRLTKDSDLWETFPLAGFFREPISNACPNKIVLCKGNVQISSGQHYAVFDGEDTYGDRWNHPNRYPVDDCFVQVHHFKWDYECYERLRQVVMTKTDYSYHEEYKRMWDYLLDNNLKINTNEFLFEDITKKSYSRWNLIREKCINYRYKYET